MLLRESLGISADGSEKAFMAKDVEEMIARKCPPIPYDVRNPKVNTQHFFVAVDPSGGGERHALARGVAELELHAAEARPEELHEGAVAGGERPHGERRALLLVPLR